MNYPQIVSQDWLNNQIKPSDAYLVRLELSGCYNYRPVPIHGRKNKRYIFKYDPKTACHALLVPASIWEADKGAMPRDIFLAAGNNYKIVPLLVPVVRPQQAEAAPAPLPKAKPAKPKKSAEDAALAVLGG